MDQLLNIRQAYVASTLFLCLRSFHWNCEEVFLVAGGMVENNAGQPGEPAAHNEYRAAYLKVNGSL
jgi:hypothetical protein